MRNRSEKQELILIKSNKGEWEDRTTAINKYYVNKANGVVGVYFRNQSNRKYFFKAERIRILSPKRSIDPTFHRIRLEGRVLVGVESIVVYDGYLVIHAAGMRKSVPESQITIEQNVAAQVGAKAALDYFREIAQLVSIKTEDGQSLLAMQYEHLSWVSEASVLAQYLLPDEKCKNIARSRPLIYPFGTNASQKVAVERAFASPISLIQGPPGTGKTQTILNLIANAIRNGETVAVVSNNNAATKNVSDKLGQKGLGYLLATLGRKSNKQAFIEEQLEYPEAILNASKPDRDLRRLEAKAVELIEVLGKLIQANNDRAQLSAQIAQLTKEFELLSKLPTSTAASESILNLKNWSANDLLAVLVDAEESDLIIPEGLWANLVEIWRHGLFKRKTRRQLVALGPQVLRRLYYERALAELQGKLAGVEKILLKHDFQKVQAQVEETSWALFLANLASRIIKKSRPRFSESDLKSRYSEILSEYPVVLSTTHSLKTSLSPECLYDLVIVDEASQVDLATGVLVLSCAKRAVIVGDENQLPNVIPEKEKQDSMSIWRKYNLPISAWNYAENSLLASAMRVWPQAPNTLLREHYRCHPKIAGFFNRQFYANQLILMTRDAGESHAIQAFFTAPGNHARGHINQRQIDVIRTEIVPALLQRGLTDIGVIAPYRAQVASLKQSLGDGVEVDTVHGFQGREKDAIILSTVDNEIGDFVDDPQMLNVAVSRAKKSFTAVLAQGQDKFHTNFGDLIRYIRYENQSITQSHVRSIFDMLYAPYFNARQKFLKARGRRSAWDSENLAEALIREVLKTPEFARMRLECMRHVPLSWLGLNTPNLSEREQQFVMHPWAHVDLVVYDTIGKEPLVAIEIDGWAYHRPGSLQSIRDEIKNSIFSQASMSLVRLSTTGSGEKNVIAEALRKAVAVGASPEG
jgi:RecA/RadA recombinase